MIRKLDIYLLRSILPVFLVSLFSAVLLLQLVELFKNLTSYLSMNVTSGDILKTVLFYLPKTISLGLPMALLFAVSYSIGTLYSQNELITIFGSGVSILQFTRSLLLVGLIFSLGNFVFDDTVVLNTLRQKSELTKKMLKQESSLSNSNMALISNHGRVIYNVGYFNDQNQTLSSVLVVIKDENGRIVRRVDAQWADWVDNLWVLNKARVFNYHSDVDTFTETYMEKYQEAPYSSLLNEKKEAFQRKELKIEELSFVRAFSSIESIKQAGLPFKDLETDLYQRISYSLTPFVVILLSSGIGGRFKKNILLASLIISLILMVGYYVLQMIFSLLAKLGYLYPQLGAFLPFFVALAAGIYLYSKART